MNTGNAMIARTISLPIYWKTLYTGCSVSFSFFFSFSISISISIKVDIDILPP